MTFDRARSLGRLADERFDVLVVGGGITGAGVVLDAAARGLRTALVERDDFASGTSSKSSKLVHGGLRYLQQREIGLVYEGLAERQILRTTAPHLVRVLPFLLPVLTKGGILPKSLSRALGSAMWMYDLFGGLRIGKRHERISADRAVEHMPTLRRENLASSYVYYDAHADDARLTLAIARSAADHGAAVANQAAVVGISKDRDGQVSGAHVEADGERIDVSATTIVNATGVWADALRTMDEGSDPDSLRPAKGIHLTVPWDKVRNDIAVVIPVREDRRSIFVVPWEGITYVGTTDTDYDGPIDDPQCTPEDVSYLLDALNRVITEPVTEADILGTWAGLRPLVRSAESDRTADLSRRHSVSMSDSGVVTVIGGKLTTYRRMAADTVDSVMDRLDRRGKSRTKKIRLRGGHGWNASDLDERLAARYGSDARRVQQLVEKDPSLGDTIAAGLPYTWAEVTYAVTDEMARTVDDVLARRTRARLLGRDASLEAAARTAEILGEHLGWSAQRCRDEAERYRTSVATEAAATDPATSALDAMSEPS